MASKSAEIVGFFSENAIRHYFRTFFPQELTEPNVLESFRKHYHRRFGRRHFILPAMCLLGIAGFLLVLVTETLQAWLKPESDTEFTIPAIAVLAIAGAYMWVLFDLITRARCLDLDPADLFWASFRFIVAIPLGFSFSAVLKDDFGLFIAFILGAFPTQTLMTMVRRVGTSRLNLEVYAEEAGRELEKLQGINRGTAERFGYEGVRTILQLAYADPVDLTLRSSFSFSYVIDCCSQALAWIYFEDTLEGMRRFGLRGAQEINTLMVEINDPENDGAVETLKLVAAAIGMDPTGLRHTLREIAEDPYTIFLCDVWAEVAEDH
jgi:hypothetical protein